MQICKSKKAVFFFALFSGFFCGLAFSQNSTQTKIEMPAMPSMPEMPSVGGSFYTPSFPTSPTAPKSPVKPEAQTETAAQANSQNGKTEALQNSALVNSNYLTADDISALYDSGLFSNISSLNTTNITNNNTSNTTNVILQQVLNSLNDLKKQQENASAKDKNQLIETKADSENFKKREPSILRFKINGFNVADSFTQVFFSETEPDGTFLLTGDRKYYINQQPRTETFYMLFKTTGSNGSTLTYKVQTSVVQDFKNENSFMYRLSAIQNLTAEKTGNLVVIHYSDNAVKADILLDIDCK